MKENKRVVVLALLVTGIIAGCDESCPTLESTRTSAGIAQGLVGYSVSACDDDCERPGNPDCMPLDQTLTLLGVGIVSDAESAKEAFQSASAESAMQIESTGGHFSRELAAGQYLLCDTNRAPDMVMCGYFAVPDGDVAVVGYTLSLKPIFKGDEATNLVAYEW